MACEFPVAVKSKVDAKQLYAVYFTLLLQAVSPQVTIGHPPGGYLPSRRASPPLGRYQVILLGDIGT